MELDKKVVVTQSSKEVSSAGVQELNDYLRKELDMTWAIYFPCDWLWDWIHTGGEYRGKLPNRIAAWIKSYYGLKLTPEQKSMLGNISRKHLCTKDNYTVDFTGDFDWCSGDFGDYGSCFWGINRLARQAMENEGILAIRFYDERGGGIGRAWIYELSEDAWVLFNAYGIPCPEAASVFAINLERDTEDTWEYSELDYLTVDGGSGGLIYINGQPQIVYRKGHDPESFVNLDFYLPYRVCDRCEDWAHEDDLRYDEDFCGSLCEDCYETLLAQREEKRLEELEELSEQGMEEEFRDAAGRAEIAHVMAQEAIRDSVTAQLVAGQLAWTQCREGV